MTSNPSIPERVAAVEAARRAALAHTLAETFPAPADIIIELGCGHGHFLTAYAAAHPEVRCLGVDLISDRIRRAEKKRARMNLANVVFLKADAAEALAALPAHTRIAGVFALFPDPWPKKRHHRRRLLQPELLAALGARARLGAWLAFRTDDAEFFAWTRARIAEHAAWNFTPETQWPFEHPTVFQERQGSFDSLMAVRA